MSDDATSGKLVVHWTPNGLWTIAREGGPPLELAFSIHSGSTAIALAPTGEGEFSGDGARSQIRVTATPDEVFVDWNLTFDSPRVVDFCGFDLGPLKLAGGDVFFGSKPGFLERDGARSALEAQRDGDSTATLGMVVGGNGQSILAGIGDISDDPSYFQIIDDRLRAGFEPKRLLSGTHRFQLRFSFGTDPLRLLGDYGRHLSTFARPIAATPTGWNSWDFHAAAISMEDVEREMDALERLPFSESLRYVTIDMGWEERWGDWRPNRKFPESAADIAAAIKRRGWTPGVWLAPLQASMFSRLARHRQEMFVTNDDGSLIINTDDDALEGLLLLDYSLPEVRELAFGWFADLRRAGFELFKIDYLYDKYLSLCAGEMGKVAFARSIFETIRNAVGDDAHIVNCGGNKEAALGLVDSCRVTVDVHNFWGHFRNNAKQIANSFWMNRALWINDPDFAIVRCPETCSARRRNMPYAKRPAGNDADFWMRGPEASRGELRTWLSAVRLNGGSVFLSDSIATLNDAGTSDLATLFPPSTTGFTPLDLFERSHPSIWLSNDETRPLLGLFNWDDVETTLALPASLERGVTGKDAWTGQSVSITDSIRLNPRSCRLIEL